MTRLRRLFAPGLRSCAGLAVLEFALVAPVLFVALLSMMDIGRAVGERMGVDAALRTGAQVAMSDPGADAVRAAIAAVDEAGGPSAARSALAIDVQRFCACPGASDVSVACSTTCAGPAATEIFYSLKADTTFSGVFLPILSLGAENRVRVR